MSNNFKFDKFMKEIIKREEAVKGTDEHDDYQETPQRKHRRLYSERWQNRIRYTPRRKTRG